jgi:hypothetical protein
LSNEQAANVVANFSSRLQSSVFVTPDGVVESIPSAPALALPQEAPNAGMLKPNYNLLLNKMFWARERLTESLWYLQRQTSILHFDCSRCKWGESDPFALLCCVLSGRSNHGKEVVSWVGCRINVTHCSANDSDGSHPAGNMFGGFELPDCSTIPSLTLNVGLLQTS